jgi:hypothetical protein
MRDSDMPPQANPLIILGGGKPRGDETGEKRDLIPTAILWF